MKKTMAHKLTYLGVGAGLILFAIFGIVPGSFIGGAAGLSLAGAILGSPVEAGIIARVMLALSMLLGIMISGLIIITATSTVGWMMGTAVDTLTRKEAKTAEAH